MADTTELTADMRGEDQTLKPLPAKGHVADHRADDHPARLDLEPGTTPLPGKVAALEPFRDDPLEAPPRDLLEQAFALPADPT